MNAAEFIALSEQYTAFDAIMKQRLVNETELAKQVLDDLRKGRTIIELADFNEREGKRLDTYRIEMEIQFQKEQTELTKLDEELKVREEKVTKFAEELSDKERSILRTEKSKQRDFDLAIEEYQRKISLLKERERIMTEREQRQEMLEKEIDRKMMAIKAFA